MPRSTPPHSLKSAQPIVLILVLIATLFAAPPPASGAENVITITGGGWGHGIGMSQWGAKALADQGHQYPNILSHFYAGVTIGTVGTGNLVGHAEPLRIGLGQSMTRFDFTPVGGSVSLSNGALALEGQGWSLRMIAADTCQFYYGEGPQDTPISPCNGSLTWVNQPNTRVWVPNLNRTYARGSIQFTQVPNNPNAFHLLVELPLEHYLYGLAEVPSTWPTEALKAQAVAGRTYALFKAWAYKDLATHSARLNACACHLYASTLDQAYSGWDKESTSPGWVQAVDQTAGEAMTHTHSNGRAIEAYYFSSSGGSTENNEDQWGGTSRPYLRSTSDPGATTWDASQVKKMTQSAFSAALGFDDVFSATITERYVSGSPKKIVVQGYAAGSPLTKTYTGSQFRSILGLRSHNVNAITGIIPFIPGADKPVLHDPTTGKWVYNTAAGSGTSIYFGNPGDVAFMGDWNCDGVDTPGLYRQSDGYVYLRNSNTQGVADITFFFGNPGDVPLAGDFNGNGCDTVSIYRPSEQRFYVINKLGVNGGGLGAADYSFLFGNPGDVPFAGDWNNNGVDTPGLRRVSNGFVYLKNTNSTGVADINYYYGNPGDLVFAGDWDADGDDTLGLYRPSNGTIYLRNTNTTGIADISFVAGTSVHKPVAGR
jgi:SpoIID/LytB domain protein